jgi:hypothetical protein
LSGVEFLKMIGGAIVAVATVWISYQTYLLNDKSQEASDRLKAIEFALSEEKFDFERIRDVYDRTDKFLSGDQSNVRQGKALVVLISSLPESGLRKDLLSLMIIEATADAVAATAADALVPSTLSTSNGSAKDDKSPGFFGDHKINLNPDGYTVRVEKPFGYRDKNGLEWTVPADYVSDGASIPRQFWPFIGAPLSGSYTRAAIIHDYFTEQRTRPSADVHRMFYEAMIADGVSATTAQLLYTATRNFGPQWTVLQQP